jgi:crotonobetainyl-CoA:carnitine CoA-transferase CaiB-like acyl-CoA transferase
MVAAAGESGRCAEALGHPEWCEDPRFATNQRRMENRDALETVMNAVLTTKTTDHRVGVLDAAGVPCGPVYNYEQMFNDPELGEVSHIRTPVKIGESVRVRTVAPKLGQHNAEIFGRLGLSEAEIERLRAKGVL